MLGVGLALGIVLDGLSRRANLENHQADALFLFLGQTTFALAVALGFLLYSCPEPAQALASLAGPAILAGLPILATGTLVQRRLSNDAPLTLEATPGLPLGLARWLASALAMAGMAVMLAGLAMAWTAPLKLIGWGLVNALVFFGLAVAGRLAYAHAPALASLALSVVVGFHVLPDAEFADSWSWVTLLGSATATPLTGLALVWALTSEVLLRLGRRSEGLMHLAGSAGAAAAALGLAAMAGFNEPARATLVFAAGGAGAFAVNLRWRRAGASYGAGIVILLALVYGQAWTAPATSPAVAWVYALLTAATVFVAAGLAFLGKKTGGDATPGTLAESQIGRAHV